MTGSTPRGHLVERDIPLENVLAFAETVTKINEGGL